MRLLPKIKISTGRHAAKRARKEAENLAQESKAERESMQAKTEMEKRKAQKIRIRGLRSRRSSSFFAEGRETIG